MAETQRESMPLVTAALAAQFIGGLIPQTSPFIVAGLIAGLSLTEKTAGFLSSVELVTLAATAILIAPALPRLSPRRVGLSAVALALPAHVLSIFSESTTAYAILTGLAGIGEGALYALSLSLVASRSANPDRVYGYFQIAWALGSLPLFLLGGQLTQTFALRGILGLVAAFTLFVTPLLFFIPVGPPSRDEEPEAPPPPASLLLGLMTLAAIILYIAASAAIYVFSTSFGERAGLDTQVVSYVLTVATLVGLAGGAAASMINVRWGRTIPLLAFSGIFAGVVLVLCLWRDPAAFVAALTASVIIYYFSIPYLFGLAAALDRTGRWAAAAGSAYLVGFAAGPVFGGALIGAAGYEGLAVACISFTAAALLLALWVDHQIKTSSDTSPPSLGA